MRHLRVLALALLIGCGGSSSLSTNQAEIKTGMTMREVEAILGKPGATESAIGMKTIWIYREGEVRVGVGFGEDDRVARVDAK